MENTLSCHPYFWARIIGWDFSDVAGEIEQREKAGVKRRRRNSHMSSQE